MKGPLIAVFALALIWLITRDPAPILHPPGVLVASTPQQTPPANDAFFDVDEYMVRPLADIRLDARVLAKARYRWDRGADLAKWDFALGWGPMSDQAVLDQIEISQSGRWYRWQAEKLPIGRRAIETHSANMHLIASNPLVADRLGDVRVGDIVRLRGSLVRAETTDGWTWESSLTRDDTGANACELVWVEDVQIVTP